MKKDKHGRRMTVGGNNTKHEGGGVGTPTAHLEIAKMLFNSVLSRKHAKFMTIDMSNFYLMTSLENYECSRISMKTIPEEIIKIYGLEEFQHNGWVCVEIRKGGLWLASVGNDSKRFVE